MNYKNTEIIMYQAGDGAIKIDVRLENETVWLSLDQMSELFGRDKSTISRHIKNVFEEGELFREATVAKIATVQIEGDREVQRQIDCYSLCPKNGQQNVVTDFRFATYDFSGSFIKHFKFATHCAAN